MDAKVVDVEWTQYPYDMRTTLTIGRTTLTTGRTTLATMRTTFTTGRMDRRTGRKVDVVGVRPVQVMRVCSLCYSHIGADSGYDGVKLAKMGKSESESAIGDLIVGCRRLNLGLEAIGDDSLSRDCMLKFHDFLQLFTHLDEPPI